jgi:hypothetical protein
LLNPFVSKHFYSSFLCIGISITQSPAKDPFAVADTQNTEVAYFIHAAGVNTPTIDGVDVPRSLNDKQYRGASLLKIEEYCTTDLTLISFVVGAIYALGSC